jgi:D-alanyl-D-alanine carboxypeptidase (penicillin-binding protein 5/6)
MRFHYPVVRQILIVVFSLLLILSGAILTPHSDESTASSGSTVSERPYTVTDLTPTSTTPTTFTLPTDAIKAEAAIVYDVRHDAVVYQKAPNTQLPLASITKLMTGLVVAELISDETVITVSEEAVAQYGDSGLRVGEQVSAKNLTDYAILSSSNDAAYALAHSIGEQLFPEQGIQPFIDAMNIRADELDLQETVFQNPTGLDISAVESGALGSASDITRLMNYIHQNHPELLTPTQLVETRIYNANGEYHQAANTNQLVQRIPNIIGSKTGYTDLAGGNLTVLFDTGFNRPIIVTVLGSTFTGRFTDVETLIQETTQAK